jgi:hypothetical protein
MRGFREAYHPGLFEKEGILAAVLICLLPFLLLALFQKVLPVFGSARERDAAS